DDAVAAVALGRVEVLVGQADQLGGGQRLLAGGAGHAEADRHGVRLPFVLERVPLDQGADALGDGGGALAGRLRQHDGELLAAVAGEQLLLADARLDAGGQLAERVVAAQVAQVVVDRLEVVQVHHDHRQRPAVPGRAGQLAVEELQQVALVVDVGQGVDDRQPVDLLVVLGLDVAAGEVAVDAVADAQVVAVFEPGAQGRRVVDEGAVGALQVSDVVAVGAGLDAGVAARHRVVVDAQVAVAGAADDYGPVAQRVARLHAGAGRVDVDHAGVAAAAADELVRRGDPGFRHLVDGQYLFHGSSRMHEENKAQWQGPSGTP